MATKTNPLDQMRQLFANVGQGIQNTTQGISNYFNPSVSGTQGFWGTPIAQGLGNIQQSVNNAGNFVQQGATRVQNLVQNNPQELVHPVLRAIVPVIPPVLNAAKDIGTNMFTSTVYNPQTKQLFPQNYLNQSANLITSIKPYGEQLNNKQITPQQYASKIQPSVVNFASNMAVGLMGGGSPETGAKPRINIPSSDVRDIISAVTDYGKAKAGQAVVDTGGIFKNVEDTLNFYLKKTGVKTSQLSKMTIPEKYNLLLPDIKANITSRVPVGQSGLSTAPVGGPDAIKNAEQAKGLTPEVTNGKLPQQVELATTKTPTPQLSTPEQLKGDVGPSIGTNNNSSAPIIDPVQKIIDALKQAKPLEGQQAKIYSDIRSRQAGALSGIGSQMGGESGYFKKLGQLKGEMPKVQFESIRNNVSQNDINTLFNKVEQSPLSVFEKVSAQGALQKLLGAQGGSVPTKSELGLLNQVFPPEFIQAVLDNRSGFQKALSIGEGFLNLPRAIMATADLSAPLRQGMFLIGRPKQWVPAFKDMFKYAFSKNAYDGLANEIKARPSYPLMRDAKLSITDMSPMLGSREEQFMSNLTERIPIFGKLAAGSNRAYSGFLNKLRADTFDSLVNDAKKQGVTMSPDVVANIGKFVNSATGRGDLGALQRAAPILNGLLFSPRLVASRVNLLNPAYYASLDPFTRKEALKSLLGFAGTATTVLGLAKLGGAEVGTDPRSADFGKIKVGNTRYDTLGGFQQYIKLGAQLLSGQTVSTTTGRVMTLGETKQSLTRKDILTRFFESKESPVASFITGLLTNQTGIGDKFNPTTEIVSRFIPLIAQDLYDLTKEHGWQGVPMAIPGLFGAGSQTYGSQEVVQGKDQLGRPTSQIKPTATLPEAITRKITGPETLGTSAGYSVDAYYKQLKAMPPQQAAQIYDNIVKTNPDLAKKIVDSAKVYQSGITPNEETIQMKGVASGDRAIAIANEIKKLKTPQEKAKLWDRYVKLKIITQDVANQLQLLAKQGKL